MRAAFLAAAAAGLLSGCRAEAQPVPAPPPPPQPRSVVLVIGDGTGWEQWSLLLAARRASGRAGESRLAAMMRLGTTGAMTTGSTDDIVCDSAAGATALATGRKGRNGAVSVDGDGAPLPTVLEAAEGSGRLTGLVTTTALTDATPACFAAHVGNRVDQAGIARQMLASGVDVLMGGGGRILEPALAAAEAPGGRVWTRIPRERLGAPVPLPALGLFARDEIPWALDRDTPEERAAGDAPSLRDMTEAAVGLLRGSPGGYFLMVEAGLVDRACHFLDAGAALAEMEELDATLAFLLEEAARDRGLLVVLTADHETGGPAVTLPHAGTPARERVALLYGQRRAFASLPGSARRPGAAPPDLAAAREAAPWLPDDARPFGEGDATGPAAPFHGKYERAWARAASAAAGVVFANDSHSAVPVPLIAVGPGAEGFRGLMDNSDVGGALLRLLGGD